MTMLKILQMMLKVPVYTENDIFCCGLFRLSGCKIPEIVLK